MRVFYEKYYEGLQSPGEAVKAFSICIVPMLLLGTHDQVLRPSCGRSQNLFKRAFKQPVES